jgi:hypothetical protein
MLVPEHMDSGSRNERLYETLKGMGLCVVPIPDANDPSRIAQIMVSAELPPPGEQTTETGVHRAMQGTKVRKVVDSAERRGMNVVDFPSVLR